MASGGQWRRLSIAVLGVCTVAFAGIQLWGGPDAPAATRAEQPAPAAPIATAPAAPTATAPAAPTATAPAAPTATAPAAPAAAAPGAPTDDVVSSSPQVRPAGTITLAFAGDVNFEGRTAGRLAADPATVFGAATPGLAAADLTVVNLETAIATGGAPEPKSFTFRAPPSALDALREAGVDVASM
ncbi:MAG TPA: CapA family protein, partial [Nakamurella sp.]